MRQLIRCITNFMPASAALPESARRSACCSLQPLRRLHLDGARPPMSIAADVRLPAAPSDPDLRTSRRSSTCRSGCAARRCRREIETAVRHYVGEYRADGTGSITIQVPTGSANEVAAASTGHAVHYALVRAGVPRGHIEVAPYEVGDHAQVAPLRLSYLRVKAVVPTLRHLAGERQPNSSTIRDTTISAARTQQNLAAMVANPADLHAAAADDARRWRAPRQRDADLRRDRQRRARSRQPNGSSWIPQRNRGLSQ